MVITRAGLGNTGPPPAVRALVTWSRGGGVRWCKMYSFMSCMKYLYKKSICTYPIKSDIVFCDIKVIIPQFGVNSILMAYGIFKKVPAALSCILYKIAYPEVMFARFKDNGFFFFFFEL